MYKKHIFAMSLLALGFASCSQDNDLNTTADNADREIRFASSLDITTRANTADATTVQTNGFKAAAFNYTKSGATKTLGDAFVTNWAVAYSNGAWVPSETKLWPSIETNKGLDFLAYSTPQDISSKVSYASGVMTIADFTPAATPADQKELLVAYSPDQTFENTKTTGVSLAFKHALSQIAIQVKNSKSKAVTISEVKVCNAAGKGTLKYGYEQALTWAQGTDKASYNLSDLSVAVPVYAAATDITNVHAASDYFMLVPQTAAVLTGEPSATSGAYFSITYKTAGATNSTTATVALPANAGSGNYKWEAGKKYLYTLELSDILTATLTSMEQINALWSDFGGGLKGQEQEEGEMNPDPNLLKGKFSVSATKKVKFTKGNLYWDGSAFKFEANQTDFPTAWNTNHVGHFFWSKYASVAYATSYNDPSASTSDKFFCGEDNKITVEGTGDLFALSNSEWSYLISSRTNAENLRKYGQTVGGKANCVLIAPDGFDTSKWHSNNSYTLVEVNSLGLVCLPAAGNRSPSNYILTYGTYGFYWSSTLRDINTAGNAYQLFFSSSKVKMDYNAGSRSLRLVK